MRDSTLDFSKGVLILLVVLGHALQVTQEDFTSNAVFTGIYSFHMPLFFVLAGWSQWYSVSRRAAGIKISVLGKFKVLYLPYLIWSIVVILPLWFDSGDWGVLARMLLNPFSSYWFLDILFFIFVYAKLGLDLVRGVWSSIVIVVIVLSVDYSIQHWFGGVLRLYYIVYYLPYFVFGYLVGRYAILERLDLYSSLSGVAKGLYIIALFLMLAIIANGWGYEGAPSIIDRLIRDVGVIAEVSQYCFRFGIVLMAFIFISSLSLLMRGWVKSGLIGVGGMTLEIYVLHILLMNSLVGYIQDSYLLFVIVGAGTVFIVYLLRRLCSKASVFGLGYQVLFGRAIGNNRIRV